MPADLEFDEEAFAAALAGDDDARRLFALDALQECDRRGPLPPEVLEPLLDCLRSRRKAVQRTAAEVLALWSRVTPGVRARLVERLGDPELHARFGAAFALARIGPDSGELLSVLLETLGQADGDLRWAAQGIVVALARREPKIVPRLSELVETGSSPQRKMALYALRDLGEATPRLRDAMMSQLAHPDPEVRMAALSALARSFGSDDALVEPIVERVRDDSDAGVRRAAVSTLGKLRPGRGGETIDRVLEESLSSEDPALRRAAIGARHKRGEG